ncbi:Hypothetical protein UVM_LOCUS114 [uncultured virus]|nr:Hypothetical protein UVM_LOCUS114 [uncultured virus]
MGADRWSIAAVIARKHGHIRMADAFESKPRRKTYESLGLLWDLIDSAAASTHESTA